MKGIAIGFAIWAAVAVGAIRFGSSKWHPDKGRSLEEALAPYERRTDEDQRTA